MLLVPMAELAADPAAQLAFSRAFSRGGSRNLFLTLMADGQLAEVLADALWPRFEALTKQSAASAGELHAKFAGEGQGFEAEVRVRGEWGCVN